MPACTSARCSSASEASGGDRVHVGAHHAAHRGVRQPVGDRPAQILAVGGPDQHPVARDLHARGAPPAALVERVLDGRRVVDEPRRRRHHVARQRHLRRRPPAAPRARPRWTASRERPRTIADAACGWPPPPSAGQGGADVQRRRAAAADDEHAALHLHGHHQRLALGQLDDLAGHGRDAVHVARPARSGDQHPGAGDVVRLPGVDQRRQQGALLVAQRQVAGTARPAPATRRAARRTPAPRRRAAWSRRTSAIPCPRGCPGPARSPRPASARCPRSPRITTIVVQSAPSSLVTAPAGPLGALAAVVVEQHGLDPGPADDLGQLAQAVEPTTSRPRSPASRRTGHSAPPRPDPARPHAARRTRARCG